VKTATQKGASRPGRSLGDRVLVDPGLLAGHLSDADLRVVEVDVSPAAYDDWHIDGAVLWNVYTDLEDAGYRTVDTAALERLVARSGIGPDCVRNRPPALLTCA
jgi:3-mercaptopyruvate sulfurtransferase SseA